MKNDFFPIFPEMLAEFGMTVECGVYAMIGRYSMNNGQGLFLSSEKIAAKLHCSRRAVCAALAMLSADTDEAGEPQQPYAIAEKRVTEKGGSLPTVYKINPQHPLASIWESSAEPEQEEDTPSVQNLHTPVCNNCTPPVQNLHTPRAKSSQPTIKENLIEIIQERGKERSVKSAAPPTPEEVKLYFSEIGCTENPQTFHDYYTARSWQGIRDWKAAARAWMQRGQRQQPTPRTPQRSHTEPEQLGHIDIAAIQAKLDAGGIYEAPKR